MKIFSVIEYLPSPELKDEWLMYHYPGHTFNTKSKLRVQPGQVAICVNSGKVEHVFGEDTGTVDLTTANYPFLSKLIAKVAYGGDYPYDMQIYFLNITAMKNFKWGTPTQLIIESQDPMEKGFVYHAVANGSYFIRLRFYDYFLKWIAGADAEGTVTTFSSITSKLRPIVNQTIMNELTDYIENNKMSFTKVQRMVSPVTSEAMKAQLVEKFEKIGFELNDFVIEMVDVPQADQEKYEKLYAKRREFSTLSGMDPEAVAVQERQRQLDALNTAAGNQGTVGGMMGAGLGFGYGMGMYNQVNQNGMNQGGQPGQAAQPKEVVKVRCPSCGALNNENAKFCSECGAKLGPKCCPNCGAEIAPGAKFCGECGTKIG